MTCVGIKNFVLGVFPGTFLPNKLTPCSFRPVQNQTKLKNAKWQIAVHVLNMHIYLTNSIRVDTCIKRIY